MKLYWKKLLPNAKAPTVANPGEDLAYDLYAAEPELLLPGRVVKVRTGIAVEFEPARGALIRDRSSMAAKGIYCTGGVLDAGYRGEIMVMLTLDMNAPPRNENNQVVGYKIQVGDKIAQMIPVLPDTLFVVEETDVLITSARGEAGFGSTGR